MTASITFVNHHYNQQKMFKYKLQSFEDTYLVITICTIIVLHSCHLSIKVNWSNQTHVKVCRKKRIHTDYDPLV